MSFHLPPSLGLFLRGFAMGAADIIPGVSGGTMALITGIYDRLVDALAAISWEHVKNILLFPFLSGDSKQKARANLQQLDWSFFLWLLPGLVLGILLMSLLIQVLLRDYQALTYAFFFGLILMSTTIPWKLMEHRPTEYALLLLFAGGMFVLSGFHPWTDSRLYLVQNKKILSIPLSPEGKFQIPHSLGEKAKLRLLKNGQVYEYFWQADKGMLATQGAPRLFLQKKQNIWKGILEPSENHGLFYLFVSGALAICAMILPGISGAYILVLLGQYAFLFKALYEFQVLFLSVFLTGVLVGLFSFVRLLRLLLHRYHSQTMAALTGIMLGSLRKIWPFRFSLESTLESPLEEPAFFSMVLVMLAGVLLVLFLEFLSRPKTR